MFSLVEPGDVRWIFLSHDDVDHTGNLDEALTACPNAKLVCNWAMVERHTNCFDFPLDRCHWVMDGETFDAGDRTLVALRPPVFDSPTTRGLFDPTTGVYWAVDTFATPLPDPSIDDRGPRSGLLVRGHVDVRARRREPVADDARHRKYSQYVDRVQSLDITTIASCHSPVIEGRYIDRAFSRIRELPTLDAPTAAGPVRPRPDRRRDRATSNLNQQS